MEIRYNRFDAKSLASVKKGGFNMKYECELCGWVYDEAKGCEEAGIAPGTDWKDVPKDFECPICDAGKEKFKAE